MIITIVMALCELTLLKITVIMIDFVPPTMWNFVCQNLFKVHEIGLRLTCDHDHLSTVLGQTVAHTLIQLNFSRNYFPHFQLLPFIYNPKVLNNITLCSAAAAAVEWLDQPVGWLVFGRRP
jgi:hypothetical protein